MARLRILLLGPDCHPHRKSIPYVTYSHAAALAELHDVTLVTRAHVADDVRQANGPFCGLEVVQMPLLERIFAGGTKKVFGTRYNSHALTAFRLPFHLAFEWLAWRQFRKRILAGEFDLVHRIVPMSGVIPSPFSFFLRNGPIPFVIGPLQAALPFVKGFSQADNEKQWSSGLRNLYRFLPLAKSTYRHAAAIIAASSQAYSEFAVYGDKVFFVPEPGISESLCCDDLRTKRPGAKLQLIFVGGMIPCKACDLGLRAAAPLLKKGSARFTLVGDGPERKRLEQLSKDLGIENAVEFCGWLSHDEALRRLRSADVMVFPSVRDNGAGVVFEALACGAVPVVADFGGPGDIVNPKVGFKVPLTTENEVVVQIGKILEDLEQDRDLVGQLRKQGMLYARECLTWNAKAQRTTQVLEWAVRRGPKPDFVPPRRLHVKLQNAVASD